MEKLKIVLIAQNYLKRELGGPKVIIELSEELCALGHQATAMGIQEIDDYLSLHKIERSKDYAKNISSFLEHSAGQYDVAEVDANFLHTHTTQSLENRPLLVARSVLLIPRLEELEFPETIKNKASRILNKFRGKNETSERVSKFIKSLRIADVINVNNHKDEEWLIKHDFPKEKIVHIPHALPNAKRENLKKLASRPKKNKLAFIGTFDFRKGCIDLPKIFSEIKKQIPDAELSILGARGLFQSEKEIYSFFPKQIRKSVHVVLDFEESSLAEVLKEHKIGLFPSYLEGFGFAVLELISAGIPVIAYDVPGPSSILPGPYLVPSGDWKKMAERVLYFLNYGQEYKSASQELLKHSEDFKAEKIAQQTARLYAEKRKLFKLKDAVSKN